MTDEEIATAITQLNIIKNYSYIKTVQRVIKNLALSFVNI